MKDFNQVESEPQIEINLRDSEDQDLNQGCVKLRSVQKPDGVHSGDGKDDKTTLPENKKNSSIDAVTAYELPIEATFKQHRSGRKIKLT